MKPYIVLKKYLIFYSDISKIIRIFAKMNEQKFIIVNNQIIININDIVEIYFDNITLTVKIVYINKALTTINCLDRREYDRVNKEIINKLKIN